jgi:ribosomal protein S18 acetylase RimI-like enzyme
MRQWPNDPTIAHLVFLDHGAVPAATELARAIEHARRRGARAVRTSALFPRSADVVLAAGFEPIDRLSLLTVDLTSDTPPARRSPGVTTPLRPWHLWEAAEVDRDAFGPLWGNDAQTLRDIQRATPHHRSRQLRVADSMAGFVIAGAAGDQGYLQRLAVRSDRRRLGHAAALVTDVLDWMRASGLGRALVNTGSDNTAALELYERFGFRHLDDVLTVAELRLTRPDECSSPSATAVGIPPGPSA